MPLMIRWPGVAPAGVTCGEPVSSIDFYPTMLEMAGLEGDAKHNATVDGKSLVPLLKSPGARLDRDELFFHYPHYYPTTTPVSAILARDWKLLEYFEDGHLELYNLGDDPSEKRDLAAAMPDRASSCMPGWPPGASPSTRPCRRGLIRGQATKSRNSPPA